MALSKNQSEEEDPFPGYPDGIPYASPPRTRYQARARQGIAEDAEVELHYTARYSTGVIERLVTPPFSMRRQTKSCSLFSRVDICISSATTTTTPTATEYATLT